MQTCFAVVTTVAIDTGAVVLVHHIGASTAILTWVVGTIVNIYNVLRRFLLYIFFRVMLHIETRSIID